MSRARVAGKLIIRTRARLLDDLKQKTKKPDRQHIFDVLVTAQESMERKGVHEDLLDLAHHLGVCVPTGASGMLSIDDVATEYTALRTTPVGSKRSLAEVRGKLRIGMTRAAVSAVIGPPLRTQSFDMAGGKEIFWYYTVEGHMVQLRFGGHGDTLKAVNDY